ncbi:MAG: transposase, partial [Flavobacteriales bacterium CG11_big_fil_rev_8_21_14_0_20_35_7]
NAYSKSINKKYSRSGSLFQEHPKRNIITERQYLINLILYVNTNSSHHKILNFENYPYASYQSLILENDTFFE